MPDGKALKSVAKLRLEAADFLVEKQDWDLAAYLLAHSLECALKAVICKTLHLSSYPDDSKLHHHFKTHQFEVLSRLAGLEDIFGAAKKGWRPWSDFTMKFPGDWVGIRYEIGKFDEATVRLLYQCLTDKTVGKEGIFVLIAKHRRW